MICELFLFKVGILNMSEESRFDSVPKMLPKPEVNKEQKNPIKRWWNEISVNRELSSLDKIKMHDLFDSDGEMSDENLGLLKERMGERGSCLAVVHPLFYGTAKSVLSSERMVSEYKNYVENMSELIARSRKQGLPVMFFVETHEMKAENDGPFSNDNSGVRREERYQSQLDDRLLAFKKSVKEYLDIDDGEFFVVFTKPQSPTPLVSDRILSQTYNNSDLFIDQNGIRNYIDESDLIGEKLWPNQKVDLTGQDNLVATYFVSKLRQAGLKKLTLSGSYFGGMLDGAELVGGDNKQTMESGGYFKEIPRDLDKFLSEHDETNPVVTFTIEGTGESFTQRADSNFYSPASEDSSTLWISMRNEQGETKKPTHALGKITVRGCATKLMRHAFRQNIAVGISSVTFPEKLPKGSNVVSVVDGEGNRYWVDKSRIIKD